MFDMFLISFRDREDANGSAPAPLLRGRRRARRLRRGRERGKLNVAQSALSRHIRVLEEELGGALLVRGARGVSVTESGKVLLDRGPWLLGSLDDIKAEVWTENREPSGTVRLGAPSSLADIFYAPLARLFAARFPRVLFELSEGLTEEMTERLLRGEVAVALRLCAAAQRPSRLRDAGWSSRCS